MLAFYLLQGKPSPCLFIPCLNVSLGCKQYNMFETYRHTTDTQTEKVTTFELNELRRKTFISFVFVFVYIWDVDGHVGVA